VRKLEKNIDYQGAPKYGEAWNDNRSQFSAFIVRGGYWSNRPRRCRSAWCDFIDHDGAIVGFRPALSL